MPGARAAPTGRAGPLCSVGHCPLSPAAAAPPGPRLHGSRHRPPLPALPVRPPRPPPATAPGPIRWTALPSPGPATPSVPAYRFSKEPAGAVAGLFSNGNSICHRPAQRRRNVVPVPTERSLCNPPAGTAAIPRPGDPTGALRYALRMETCCFANVADIQDLADC
ncbi:uncharacterized protein LOC115598663 [Calypte anna]|uniref:uncharacterized protein LOC115598663 n=1 Tax=Calypte anna TaxID=9244 RepID=UPI0011C35E5E|nr:uncharacterized protein LOC115598663 [Calypte anna]